MADADLELRFFPDNGRGERVCGHCGSPARTGRDYGTLAGPVDPRRRDNHRCTNRDCKWSKPPPR